MKPNRRRNVRRIPETTPKKREPNIFRRGIAGMELAERIRGGIHVAPEDLVEAVVDLREAIGKAGKMGSTKAEIRLLRTDLATIMGEIRTRAQLERNQGKNRPK